MPTFKKTCNLDCPNCPVSTTCDFAAISREKKPREKKSKLTKAEKATKKAQVTKDVETTGARTPIEPMRSIASMEPTEKGVSETDIQTDSQAPARTSGRSQADIFKFVGLIAFFVIMAIVIIAIWPYISEIFEEGGLERVTTEVRDAGWPGVFILLALQFLQVVIAFIPGEVVQMAAGIIYGPWWGALIIWIGCVISSSFIFLLVRKLGAPFVQSMVPAKYVDKLRTFESSDKFNVIAFILFLIPGMPKDVFTYILPLTYMRFWTFVGLTNLARIPGIVVSTYAADGLVEGRIWQSVVLFLVLAAIAVVGLLTYNKVLDKAATPQNDSPRDE